MAGHFKVRRGLKQKRTVPFPLACREVHKYIKSMKFTPRCIHKIALLDRSGEGFHSSLETFLNGKGISSLSVKEDALSEELEEIDAQVLFIGIPELSRAALRNIVSFIPELAGVLLIYPEGIRKFQVMKDVAVAHSERVALIGALFLDTGKERRGVSLCREVGIPFLGYGTRESESLLVGSLEADPLVTLFS